MQKLRRSIGHASAYLASLLASAGAQATVQCFPQVNLSVPATTEGLYINLATGLSGVTEASVPGFDIDPYAAANSTPSGQLKFYWGPASTNNAGVVSIDDVYAVLGSGQLIGPDSLFSRAAFSGDTSAWQAGTTGYLGVRFRNENGSDSTYGWMLLTTSASMGFPMLIERWCFEDSGGPITTPLTPLDRVFVNGFE